MTVRLKVPVSINLRLNGIRFLICVVTSYLLKEPPNGGSFTFANYIGCVESLDDKLIGGLMLVPVDNEVIRMMQVAVDSKYQGEGVGRQLVEYAEKRAKEAGYSRLVMHAMLSVVSFYDKLGFVQEGDIFEEKGITFAKMVKEL